MVERLHRQLKGAIMCHKNSRWTEILPTVMLGIRSAWKEDIESTAAEMVYGQNLRLPGEFLSSTANSRSLTTESNFSKLLKEHMQQLRPVQGSSHGTKATFVFKDLTTAKFVFLRHDASRTLLQPPYDGPYKVVSRSEKTFVRNVRGRDVKVSIDRVKPAYVMEDADATNDCDDEMIGFQFHRKIVPVPRREPAPEPVPDQFPAYQLVQVPDHVPVPEQVHIPQQVPINNHEHRTRSGRRLQLTERYQAGFS